VGSGGGCGRHCCCCCRLRLFLSAPLSSSGYMLVEKKKKTMETMSTVFTFSIVFLYYYSSGALLCEFVFSCKSSVVGPECLSQITQSLRLSSSFSCILGKKKTSKTKTKTCLKFVCALRPRSPAYICPAPPCQYDSLSTRRSARPPRKG
jgi:hypothetical protein